MGMPYRAFRMPFWRFVFLAATGTGAVALGLRAVQGLGATTNLSDAFPWGLWIGFDVLCGVGLAAGGFTITAAVTVLNARRFAPIIRPTLLTAFLGYVFVVFALLVDLGQPHRIWHAAIMWNPHSVLFEVAWCVMLYTGLLAVEFSSVLFERLGLERPRRVIQAATTPLVIAGAILSTLHQSSLGSLYLIVPDKLHPLWYTPLLPILFFVSAVAAGLAMVIVEARLCERAFGHPLDLAMLEPLGRALTVALGVYGLLKLLDLGHRGELTRLVRAEYEGGLFLLEVTVGILAPVALLLIPRVRTAPRGLVGGAWLAILGFVVNRLNVSITGMERAAGVTYLPTWTEVAISLALVALGFAAFGLAVRLLPVFAAAPPAAPGWLSARRPIGGQCDPSACRPRSSRLPDKGPEIAR